jgi:hypothetical protein
LNATTAFLMARHPKPRKPERSGEAKLKIGGDLQGEPIFCLPDRRRLYSARKKNAGAEGLNLKTKETNCGRRNPLRTDRPGEERPVIAWLAETPAAGCTWRRRGKAARRAFLDVVNVVKGCREKS